MAISTDSETTPTTGSSVSNSERSLTPKRRNNNSVVGGQAARSQLRLVRSSTQSSGSKTSTPTAATTRRGLSPLQRAVSQLASPSDHGDDDNDDHNHNHRDATAFLKFVEVHGGREDRHSRVPYNCPKLNSSSHHSRSASIGGDDDGSSPAGGLAGILDSGAEWFDSWIQEQEEQKRRASKDLKLHNHRLSHIAKTYRYSQDDMLNVALDDRSFRLIQRSLRTKSAVTNNYLVQKIPVFMRNLKEQEERNRRKKARSQSPTRPTNFARNNTI